MTRSYFDDKCDAVGELMKMRTANRTTKMQAFIDKIVPLSIEWTMGLHN